MATQIRFEALLLSFRLSKSSYIGLDSDSLKCREDTAPEFTRCDLLELEAEQLHDSSHSDHQRQVPGPAKKSAKRGQDQQGTGLPTAQLRQGPKERCLSLQRPPGPRGRGSGWMRFLLALLSSQGVRLQRQQPNPQVGWDMQPLLIYRGPDRSHPCRKNFSAT